MTAVAMVLLGWLLAVIALLAPYSRVLRGLWREPVLVRPVLIFESDDWGPGPESDGAMLKSIARQLADIRDRDGRPAVMTLGIVPGRPEGAAILASDCQTYHRSTLDEARYAPIVQAMQDGCAAGVYALQRHGLEHCWPDSLLARARQDVALRSWLSNPDARSEALPSALQSRWADTACLPSRPLPVTDIEAAVREEGEVFYRLFGQRPSVAVPNTFVWTDAVERAWAADGVRCVVTCGRQFDGRNAEGGLTRATRLIFNGERGQGEIQYVVRDVYFEPARGHRAEQVWQGVSARTALGRPALIETHRESFIASPDIAEQSLRELTRALQGVKQCHPEICFLTTAALAQAFATSDSSLIARGFALRTAFFLRRMLATPGLSRVLNMSGLRYVLSATNRLLAVFVTSRCTNRSGC